MLIALVHMKEVTYLLLVLSTQQIKSQGKGFFFPGLFFPVYSLRNKTFGNLIMKIVQ